MFWVGGSRKKCGEEESLAVERVMGMVVCEVQLWRSGEVKRRTVGSVEERPLKARKKVPAELRYRLGSQIGSRGFGETCLVNIRVASIHTLVIRV